jgi:hypothetical protein
MAMGDMDTRSAVSAPLRAGVDAARAFGLTDDEIWGTVEGVVSAVGPNATVGDCLDELTAAVARGILDKERRRSR